MSVPQIKIGLRKTPHVDPEASVSKPLSVPWMGSPKNVSGIRDGLGCERFWFDKSMHTSV